jgi:hypothetical protein
VENTSRLRRLAFPPGSPRSSLAELRNNSLLLSMRLPFSTCM